MKKFIIILVLLSNCLIFGQKNYELFPSELSIQPFTANNLEPKMGFLFQLGGDKIRLDIGNSVDALHYKISEDEIFSAGIDFFTYTYLYSEKDFHFPVDAVDYLFGVNFGYKVLTPTGEYGTRIRISHISAHFVDGHRDNVNDIWKDNHNPIVYSREFVELTPFIRINDFRFYAGFTYLFHVDPTTIGKEIFQFGADYIGKNLFLEDVSPFAGIDFKINKVGEYQGNTSISAGVKIGKPTGKGFSIYLNYYGGKNIHGEYYMMNEKKTSLGINVDL